jgi:hypothetical protein
MDVEKFHVDYPSNRLNPNMPAFVSAWTVKLLSTYGCLVQFLNALLQSTSSARSIPPADKLGLTV